MKKFAILRKDRTILVKTPIPYVVDAYKDSEQDVLEHTRYELDEHTKFLYNCLKMLGISKSEAQRLHYTLNQNTGDRLYTIAINHPHISHEMRQVLGKYNW